MTATGPSGRQPRSGADEPAGAGNNFFGDASRPVFVAPSDPADTIDPSDSSAAHLDDDELDSEFAPQPRKKLGKLTIGLAALLVAGAGFLGGLQVQQHEGTTGNTSTAARRAATTGTGTGAGGFGAGGFAGRGTGAGAGAGAGGTGAGAGGTGAGTGTTTTVPAVIGQIVSVTGDTVVVKNLGGQTITVKLSGTTTITQTTTAADLKAGQNVTVSGTTGSDGTVTATAVGAR
jgi:Domain of unknown function (DUF5666)